MKIEHKMLHDLIRATESAGYIVMAETRGLYGYKNESEWLEVHGVSRRYGGESILCLSARKPGRKEFRPIAIAWFTGNLGIEKRTPTKSAKRPQTLRI